MGFFNLKFCFLGLNLYNNKILRQCYNPKFRERESPLPCPSGHDAPVRRYTGKETVKLEASQPGMPCSQNDDAFYPFSHHRRSFSRSFIEKATTERRFSVH